MQRSALCRSRRELSNAYLLAKFGFDAAENEPCQVCPIPRDAATEAERVRARMQGEAYYGLGSHGAKGADTLPAPAMTVRRLGSLHAKECIV